MSDVILNLCVKEAQAGENAVQQVDFQQGEKELTQ